MEQFELHSYQLKIYDKWVQSHEFTRLGEKMTVCLLTLKTGFELIGTSGCADPAKFNYDVGCRWALVDALNQLGQYDTFYEAKK